ncbi:MAG: protein arginine kinase [Waddliaceae bacterium]
MIKNNKLSLLYQEMPWTNNENNIWLATTLNLYRNLEKFPFPIKLEKDPRHQIISLVSKRLLHSQHLVHPFLIRAEEMNPLQKEYLVEHFLCTQSFQQAHSGEAFILDETGRFLATVNVGDHLHLQMIDCRGEIEPACNHLIKIETEVGESINYSFSPKFGFLTSNIADCGIAFVLTVYLQLSALIHTGSIDQTFHRMKQEALTIAGITGDPEKIIGDIYAISNHFTLGLTEENVISTMRLLLTKLLVEENSQRTRLHREENAEVKDKVSRAYGLLVHSYQLEAIEALDAISLLKLGVDLGWLKGITSMELNRLFFNCRRAHLLSHHDQDILPEEIAHKRAEFIHEALKNASLVI